MNTTLQPSDPRSTGIRLVHFVRERFLPIPQLVLVVTLAWYGAAFGAAARPLGTGSASTHGTVAAVVMVVLCVSFFFRLRVFDDVKDAAYDRVHELSRPIPRGLVSEAELNWLAAGLLLVELLLTLPLGSVCTLVWVIAAGWTLLMRVEFFCGEWLDRHITTYAATHMASMIPFAALASTAGRTVSGHPASSLTESLTPNAMLLLAWTATFAFGMGFEFGRKFGRYHDALKGGAWVIWALAPAAGAELVAAGLAQIDARQELMVGIAIVVAAAGLTGYARVRSAGIEESQSLIEMTPSILGLLSLIAAATLVTMEIT